MAFFQVLANGLIEGSIFAIIALSLTLVWGIMDVVNFAQGEYLMLSMYMSYGLWTFFGLDPVFSIVLIVPVFFLFGYLTYKVLISRIITASIFSQILTTFGLMIFLRYVAFNIFGPNFRRILDPILEGRVSLFGIYLDRAKLCTAAVCIAGFILLTLFMRKTKTGKALQTTAQDREVALSFGIDVEKMYALAWGISIALVGVAGTLISSFRYVDPSLGDAFLLLAFAAVILGGTGKVAGALLGGIIMGLVANMFGFYISPGFKMVMVFSIFIFTLMVKPEGLIGD
jgi:branched-chain amino acid transport system permease protein